MRKWECIAELLKQKKVPEKVVSAAKEIDNVLLSLGLNAELFLSSTDISWEDIDSIINDRTCCPACINCRFDCCYCLLGDEKGCTPRSKHADNYFKIVSVYVGNERGLPPHGE